MRLDTNARIETLSCESASGRSWCRGRVLTISLRSGDKRATIIWGCTKSNQKEHQDGDNRYFGRRGGHLRLFAKLCDRQAHRNHVCRRACWICAIRRSGCPCKPTEGSVLVRDEGRSAVLPRDAIHVSTSSQLMQRADRRKGAVCRCPFDWQRFSFWNASRFLDSMCRSGLYWRIV